MKYFDTIRAPAGRRPLGKQALFTTGILLLGIIAGTFSKYLDHGPESTPALLAALDRMLELSYFLGGFAPWIVSAVCIAVYSQTPVRAAVNVFAFFAGMVSSYYLYTIFVLGFFPKNYAMIWVAFTFLSPFLAFLCWYATGKGWPALLLSAGVLGMLFNTSFAYGWLYIDVRSWLNVLMLLAGAAVLRRKKKETLLLAGAGVAFAVLMELLLPVRIW